MTDRIDVLVNNAGALLDARSLSEDGFERTFAVNHLAPFLMTNLMLPELRKAPSARIITVSSNGHAMIPDMRWDDLQMKHGFTAFEAYAQSKLANILFTRELSRRLSGSGIVANAVHPGLVASRFPATADDATRGYYAAAVADGIALTEEAGADTVIWLATHPEIANATGGYYFERQLSTPSAAASSDAGAERLWRESADMAGIGADWQKAFFD